MLIEAYGHVKLIKHDIFYFLPINYKFMSEVTKKWVLKLKSEANLIMDKGNPDVLLKYTIMQNSFFTLYQSTRTILQEVPRYIDGPFQFNTFVQTVQKFPANMTYMYFQQQLNDITQKIKDLFKVNEQDKTKPDII